MKRIIDTILYCSLAVITVACGRNEKFSAETQAIAGEVMIYQAKSGRWEHAAMDMRILSGDSLRVPADGQLKLASGSNTLIFEENSRAAILESEDSTGQTVLEVSLSGGTVLSEVSLPGGSVARYQVRTPDLLAVSKGTYFSVTFDIDTRTTHVDVLHGHVLIYRPSAPAETVTVDPGSSIVIVWHAPLPVPQPIALVRWQRLHPLFPPGHAQRFARHYNFKPVHHKGKLTHGHPGPGPVKPAIRKQMPGKPSLHAPGRPGPGKKGIEQKKPGIRGVKNKPGKKKP